MKPPRRMPSEAEVLAARAELLTIARFFRDIGFPWQAAEVRGLAKLCTSLADCARRGLWP